MDADKLSGAQGLRDWPAARGRPGQDHGLVRDRTLWPSSLPGPWFRASCW